MIEFEDLRKDMTIDVLIQMISRHHPSRQHRRCDRTKWCGKINAIENDRRAGETRCRYSWVRRWSWLMPINFGLLMREDGMGRDLRGTRLS